MLSQAVLTRRPNAHLKYGRDLRRIWSIRQTCQGETIDLGIPSRQSRERQMNGDTRSTCYSPQAFQRTKLHDWLWRRKQISSFLRKQMATVSPFLDYIKFFKRKSFLFKFSKLSCFLKSRAQKEETCCRSRSNRFKFFVCQFRLSIGNCDDKQSWILIQTRVRNPSVVAHQIGCSGCWISNFSNFKNFKLV